jgi:putative methanogenesis marker protein 12
MARDEILQIIKSELGFQPSELQQLALSYSMGDGLARIVGIREAENRGLQSVEGAGDKKGGGSRVYEALYESSWPVILIPGIHRGSDVDERMKVFSHGMSPEKVGLAYLVSQRGYDEFIISDASSNTVTFAVHHGKIAGAIDAPIFAPGLQQGPLDVEAIRMVDAGIMTANQAFSRGGILQKMEIGSIESCTLQERDRALSCLALFSAMEIASLMVLMKDLGSEEPALFIAGDPSYGLSERVSRLLRRRVGSLQLCDAAVGAATIARDVFEGRHEILGIEVDPKLRKLLNYGDGPFQ